MLNASGHGQHIMATQHCIPTLDFVKVDNLRENRIYCWQLLIQHGRTKQQGMEMTTAHRRSIALFGASGGLAAKT